MIATSDPRISYSLRRDRGHNWSMTVYVGNRDVTSIGFTWNRPLPARAEAVAVKAAQRYL